MRKKSASVTKAEPVRPTGGVKAATRPAAVEAGGNVESAAVEQVRLRAYQKWEAAGRPCGDGVTFWLQAERELGRPG